MRDPDTGRGRPMAQHEAIIVLMEGADPAIDRFTSVTDDATTTVAAVPDPSVAGPTAACLVDDGAERIELCGGLGPETAGDVVAAVEMRVPVGAVSFGIESVDGAATFRDRITDRTPLSAGFVYLHEGLDPVWDRTTVEVGPLRTMFVPVPDETDAVDVAATLVDSGATLIELYGGIGAVTTRRVIDAVAGKAPVGSARYGRS